jgi:hypothetical protein
MQTFGILRELLKHHYHTYGLVMGGANRATEAQKLAKGNTKKINEKTFFTIFVSHFHRN